MFRSRTFPPSGASTKLETLPTWVVAHSNFSFWVGDRMYEVPIARVDWSYTTSRSAAKRWLALMRDAGAGRKGEGTTRFELTASKSPREGSLDRRRAIET